MAVQRILSPDEINDLREALYSASGKLSLVREALDSGALSENSVYGVREVLDSVSNDLDRIGAIC